MKRKPNYKEWRDDKGHDKKLRSSSFCMQAYGDFIQSLCHIMFRDEVSTSMYLYGCNANVFDDLVTDQESFVSVRMRAVEAIIRRCQGVRLGLRDDERLAACLKARDWCEKMMKEIRE